jgi:hypothetical protein
VTDARIHLISLIGTIAIIVGGAWIAVAGTVHAISTRRRWAPGIGRVRSAHRLLAATLGPAGLPAAGQNRAVRLAAQYLVFRTWVRWAYRLPLLVLVVGELLHLAANVLALHRHAQIHTWRIVSNGIGFAGSIVVIMLITWLLLQASPRLSLVRTVLTTAAHVRTLTDEARDLQTDRVLRAIARLEAEVTSYFTLSHPARDRYTRARVLAVNNGLYGQIVDVKQNLIFAEAPADARATAVLWNILAVVAADPTALADAEASAADGRVADAAPARIVYRAAAVVTVLTVIAGVAALWYADHSALSVIFSAVVAPLLLPVIIGLSRRGWGSGNRREPANAESANAESTFDRITETALIMSESATDTVDA